jgi:antitoxin (DNA-binding transcriptional repressor) of toxin-antitoxin stability system
MPGHAGVDEEASRGYLGQMRSVGLKVLKNRLSEFVRLAAAGETVLVTDRTRVVAELVPPQPGRDALSDDELVAQGVREGWLTPARAVGPPLPSRRPVTSWRELEQELRQDREDR